MLKARTTDRRKKSQDYGDIIVPICSRPMSSINRSYSSARKQLSQAMRNYPPEPIILMPTLRRQSLESLKVDGHSHSSKKRSNSKTKSRNANRSMFTINDWQFLVKPVSSLKYKYYVGPGNNAGLIIQLMQCRSWWMKTDLPEEANFVWTQCNHKPSLKRLGLNKSSIDNSNVLQQHTTHSMQHIRHAILRCAPKDFLLHCRLPGNKQLSDKKYLLKNMKAFYTQRGIDPFTKVPLSFHIPDEMDNFIKYFRNRELWIVKPGENTNRGKGIKVMNKMADIQKTISSGNRGRTYIVQKYIPNPLLINNRKFDIRCYALVSYVTGSFKAYFYKAGYIRTSSREFDMKNTADKFIHLTNDAVQKKCEDYGKFEYGNKLSFLEMHNYMARSEADFFNDVLPQIKQMVLDSLVATRDLLNPNGLKGCFEVLGYDFMVDEDLNVWMIEVNTNPCLELSSPYLVSMIPRMVESAFRIVVDPIFPPPSSHGCKIESSNFVNEFELILS